MLRRIDGKKKKTRKDKNDSYFPLLTLSLYLTIEFHTLLTYQHLRLSLRVDLANRFASCGICLSYIRHCTYFFFVMSLNPCTRNTRFDNYLRSSPSKYKLTFWKLNFLRAKIISSRDHRFE